MPDVSSEEQKRELDEEIKEAETTYTNMDILQKKHPTGKNQGDVNRAREKVERLKEQRKAMD